MPINLSDLTISDIEDAFENNGLLDQDFKAVKFTESRLIGGLNHFCYNGLWHDLDQGEDGIAELFVWVAADGRLLADCSGHTKYISDFM